MATLPSLVGLGGWVGARGHPAQLWVQVLGREGPFPLILLPQFGGYWIEGTNHQLSGAPEPPLNPAPGTRVRLEGNHTAKIYRKHFLGKVGTRECGSCRYAWAQGSCECGCTWGWTLMDMEGMGAHG